jgi:hypothetical protein
VSVFLIILAIKSASLVNLPSTKACALIWHIPLLKGDNNSHLKIKVSPGTTGYLNFALSILAKKKLNNFEDLEQYLKLKHLLLEP